MLGLDFGTTNSSVGVARSDGTTELARFALRKGIDSASDEPWTSTFRSVLHFSAEGHSATKRPTVTGGPQAIASFLDEGVTGRFLQSLKSYLGSVLFEDTMIFGWRYTLEELIAIILAKLRDAAREQLGDPGCAVLIGRPAHFVTGEEGAVDLARDEHALTRLRKAAELAGFEKIDFAYEPVAAAHEYERRLDHDELVLIGDFGGGTSDFCLVRLGPSSRGGSEEERAKSILGVDGVPIAGGTFDGRIVRAVIAPRLGLGSLRRSEHGKELPVPAWIYSRLERWEDVSFLKSRDTMERLKRIRFQAVEPSKIDSLIRLVEDDLGYPLYRVVEGTKVALSSSDTTRLLFRELPRRIDQQVRRADFEAWLARDVERLSACVDRLLERVGAPASAVDRVFLTGGSSLVPCVRSIFAARFGEDRLRGGEELTTVARGLALLAADRGGD